MRLSPRDLNFVSKEDSDENLCCVLRLELIDKFIMKKTIEGFSNEKSEKSEKNENSEETKLNEKKNTTIEKNTEISSNFEKFLKFQEYLLKNKVDKSKNFKFNSNLFTNVNFIENEKTGSKKIFII